MEIAPIFLGLPSFRGNAIRSLVRFSPTVWSLEHFTSVQDGASYHDGPLTSWINKWWLHCPQPEGRLHRRFSDGNKQQSGTENHQCSIGEIGSAEAGIGAALVDVSFEFRLDRRLVRGLDSSALWYCAVPAVACRLPFKSPLGPCCDESKASTLYAFIQAWFAIPRFVLGCYLRLCCAAHCCLALLVETIAVVDFRFPSHHQPFINQQRCLFSQNGPWTFPILTSGPCISSSQRNTPITTVRSLHSLALELAGESY